jgi:hypothetical protein
MYHISYHIPHEIISTNIIHHIPYIIGEAGKGAAGWAQGGGGEEGPPDHTDDQGGEAHDSPQHVGNDEQVCQLPQH